MTTRFLEKFVLAEDRDELVEKTFEPDTENYWYFKLLTLWNGDADGLQKGVDHIKKLKNPDVGESPRIQNLLFRQAVRTFSADTAESTIELLKQNNAPELFYERDEGFKGGKVVDRTMRYKSTIQVNTAALLKSKFNGGGSIMETFTPHAADYLTEQDRRGKLSDAQIGELISLIDTEAPTFPYLLTLVKKDLKNCKFGDRQIHFKLTRKQMDTLSSKQDDLQRSSVFVETYAKKLRPVSDISLLNDLDAKGYYLEELTNYVTKKVKGNANIKALVIFNTLIFREQQGYGYDKALIERYLKIPKQASTGYSKKTRDDGAALDFTLATIPELDPISNDLGFVTRALTQFYLDGDSDSLFQKQVDPAFARPLYAEVFLTDYRNQDQKKEKALVAQQEVISEYLGRGANKNLAHRKDLQLAPDNRTNYGVDDGVAVKVFVKNISRLLINVYDINAKNYYVMHQQEIPIDINLFGASPLLTATHLYNDPPIVRRPRVIQIPKLAGRRGTFAVDIIGGGLQARAIVRKGELRFVEEEGPNGTNFTVFNELGVIIPQANIWMGGRDYAANEEGIITLPFSEGEDETQLIVLENKNEIGATLQYYIREKKVYDFDCGIFIERESILERQQAKIIIRPNLYLNMEVQSAELIKNAKLFMKWTEADGDTYQRVERISLYDDKETVFEHSVPNEVQKVEFRLSGTVDGDAYENNVTYTFNGIDQTDFTGDVFLYPYGVTGYVMAVLGKNGEPLAGRVVDLTIQHRYLKKPLKFVVESDPNGRVFLGQLRDCKWVEARARDPLIFRNEDGLTERFELLEDKVNVPPVVNAKAGDTVRIPFLGLSAKGPRIYVFDSAFIESFTANASYSDGYIEINGLPAGDFKVFVRSMTNAQIDVQVSDGVEYTNAYGNFIISQDRFLQLSEEEPLQVRTIKGSRDRGYTIQLGGVNGTTRCNIISSTFVPCYSMFAQLASKTVDPDVTDFTRAFSEYADIGPIMGEYSYVLQRQTAERQIGNTLPKPSFVQKSFSPDPTLKRAERACAPAVIPHGARLKKRFGKKARKKALYTEFENYGDDSNLEFMAEPAAVYSNVQINDDGTVNIPAEWLRANDNLLQILATDDDNTTLRYKVLDKGNTDQKYRDARLAPGLDPQKRFTEFRKIECLQEGDQLKIENYSYTETEDYNTVASLLQYYRTLAAANGNAEAKKILDSFEFIGSWNTFSEEEKLGYLDKFFSNELNLFIKNRDNEFFELVVRGLLQSKLQKTFFDRYLLDDPRVTKFTALGRERQLNAFEKILLASRVGHRSDYQKETLRQFQEAAELIHEYPQDTDRKFSEAFAARRYDDQIIDGLDIADAAETGQALETVVSPLAEGADPSSLTVEYSEVQYYGIPFSKQTGDMIRPTKFWNEYAIHVLGGAQAEGKSFLSRFFMDHATSYEALISLSIIDVPFQAEAAKLEYIANTNAVTFTATTPLMIANKGIRETEFRAAPMSVSVNFVDPTDSWELFDGEQVDKYIAGDGFLNQKVYEARVVVTNVSGTAQTVEILYQIPTGSIPTGGGFRTKNEWVTVGPFATELKKFRFYFPQPGTFQMAPVTVNKGGCCIGFGLDLKIIKVSDQHPPPDTASYEYLSQHGTEEEILNYLETKADVPGLDFGLVAWRCQDPNFFAQATRILRDRGVYSETLWAYSLNAASKAELKEYLAQNQNFIDAVYPSFSSDLITMDSEQNNAFQYLEYNPLVNDRVRPFGFTNGQAEQQYRDFLTKIGFASNDVGTLSALDKLQLVYYLLLQNKSIPARELFWEIDPDEGRALAEFNYDYMDAYLALYDSREESMKIARDIVAKYVSNEGLLPKQKAAVASMNMILTDFDDQHAQDDFFDEAAAGSRAEAAKPFIEFSVENREVTIKTRNVDKIAIKFFRTDIEMMFSHAPFPDQHDVAYTTVMPTSSKEVEWPEGQPSLTFPLPKNLHNCDFILEVSDIGSGTDTGLRKYKRIHDNYLIVQYSRDLGQIRVLNQGDNRPIAGAYVKVYGEVTARKETLFYKDGYTDFRGRFNVATLSTSQQDDTNRLAILVMTEDCGCQIDEVEL